MKLNSSTSRHSRESGNQLRPETDPRAKPEDDVREGST